MSSSRFSIFNRKKKQNTEDAKALTDTKAIRDFFDGMKKKSKSQFKVGVTLGTGTFGRVRLVTQMIGGKNSHFALKILKKSEIIRLKQVEHIKAEKNILFRVDHPFIVNLYSTFQDDLCLYMLMEYVIGGELFSYLRTVGRFDDNTSRFYAAEICLALEYLHSKNFVYRDLKPENLLIDKSGHIKITDFGFAKEVTEEFGFRTWTLCGTPEYLAPEIIQSKGHGKAVDWWALGILIYEMLAGYPPFYDQNPFGIYQKILKGRLTFPAHFDVNARDLVKRLLEKDRTLRYGCLINGAEDIKNHAWFKGVNWTNCVERKMASPYTPSVKGLDDTSCFDKYPDSAPGSARALKAKEKELFVDF